MRASTRVTDSRGRVLSPEPAAYDLPLVHHAIGVMVAIQLRDRDAARDEAEALLDALVMAEDRAKSLPVTAPPGEGP